MILSLRLLFISVLVTMAWGTVRATLAHGMFSIPAAVTSNPWFQVTLLDAWFAFLTACIWVAWKEQRLAARILWVLGILLWGNFAIATYMLVELFRLPVSGSLDELFTRKRPGNVALPAAFTASGVVVYLASIPGLWR